MKTTFLKKDVEILLEDMTNKIKPETMQKREQLIKSGSNAYDMVPYESIPTKENLEFYEKALDVSATDTARAVINVAEKIYDLKGKELVLVSLARGGVPAGVLVKRYLDRKYNLNISHYALTLVGTKGIDENALKFILSNHEANKIQFIDGWTGKGAITRALKKALEKFEDVSSELAVISDPANMLNLCGTHEDILIASACLNAPLTGLLSRAVPLENSFFGAVFFSELKEYDRTYDFIEKIESNFNYSKTVELEVDNKYDGLQEVQDIAKNFGINDIHFIKPGTGETVRALIRKKPDIVLVKSSSNKYIELVKEFAMKNDLLIQEYPLVRYNMCGIYKDSNSDIL